MKRPPIIIVQLIHIFGPMKGEIQEFSEGVISIGRHPSCNLHFPTELTNISRKHAEITREGNQFKLIDLSKNGTFVNGKRVKEIYLKNGDVLAFSEGGPKVSFLTQMKEVQAEAEKPPVVQPAIEEPGEISIQKVNVPLIIQYGPTLRSFKELPVTIGKNPKCDFILDHPAIFELHAQIFFSQNQYWVKDITGQRLIRINRQPIDFKSSLKLNDIVALSPQGPVFRFLGDGRLAEVTEPSVEEPSISRGRKEEAIQREIPEEKESKGLLSKFKKLLKH